MQVDRRTRTWLLVSLALFPAAGAAAILWGLTSHTPLQAARHCVRVGMDRPALEKALGGPPDCSIRDPGQPYNDQRWWGWKYGDDLLIVQFDVEGRVAKADVYRERVPMLWERLRDWLQW